MIYLLIIIFLSLIFFTKFDYNFKLEPLNYLFRSFQHADLIHLLVNLYSFWQLRNLSQKMKPVELISAILIIWIISSLLLYAVHTFIPGTKVHTVGFSGIILGLVLVHNNYNNPGQLGLISTELLIQILPHFLMPGISFWGHLSGKEIRNQY